MRDVATELAGGALTACVAGSYAAATVPAIVATTGDGFSGLVATFTSDPADPASDFTAVIDWGDGSATTTGTITAPNTPTGAFQVSGQHTYATAGSDTVSVTITYTSADGSTSTASASGTATVSDLAVSSQTVQASEGTLFTGTVATFADVSTSSLVDASATITWGDGTSSSTGTIEPDPSAAGLYDVDGTHVYAQTGTDTITIDVTDDGDTGSGTSTADVADAAITASSNTISPTAGEPFTGVVATFTDADTTRPASDFTATIDWGDGVTSTATIVADPSTAYQFDVTGTHTFTEAGSYDLTADVADVAGATAAADGTADVADAPLTGIAQTIAPVAGTQFNDIAAVFSDPNLGATASDFTATITWGDGGTSTATVSAAGAGAFDVSGTYTYEQFGTYPMTVQVTSSGGSTVTIDSTANVADAPLTATTNTNPPQPTAGTSFDSTVADFTDSNSYATAAQFTASITWGDGTSSSGTVSANGAGGFEVDGTHTYTTYGSDSVSVAITSQGGSTLTVNSTVTVADAAISAAGTTATTGEGDAFSGEIATFTDANPYATASQFTATINWGDDTTSTGTVSVDPEFYDQFDVTGTHTYTVPGSFPVFVTVSDAGGQSATAQSDATTTSANAPQALADAGAAGAVNTAVSGSGDTNTASFDLGFVSLAVMNPTTNTGGSDGNAAPTPNTDVVTPESDPAVAVTDSYTNTTIIHSSGPDWTLTESIVESFVLTVTGTSTSGSFTEDFRLTIAYQYDQWDSETSGTSSQSLTYSQTGSTVIVATASGTYTVSDGATSVNGQYSDSQLDNSISSLVQISATTGSGPADVGVSDTFLTENGTDGDSYLETGVLAGAGTVVSGASNFSSIASTNYGDTASATTADGAAIVTTSARGNGMETLDYSEASVLNNPVEFGLYENRA